MRADVVQRPVALPGCVDSAPVGAAMLAAVAGGLVRDLDAAVDALPDRQVEIAPDPRAAAAYDQAYDQYRRLFSALRPLFAPPDELHKDSLR
jgi:xylulokinase